MDTVIHRTSYAHKVRAMQKPGLILLKGKQGFNGKLPLFSDSKLPFFVPVAICKNKKRRLEWNKLTDPELILAAKQVIAAQGIRSRTALKLQHSGLHGRLIRRGLLESVSLDSIGIDWASMGDKAVIEYAKEFIAANKITTRKGLEAAPGGRVITVELYEREIIDDVGLPLTIVPWSKMKYREFIVLVNAHCEVNGLANASDLAENNPKMYNAVLRRRKRFPNIWEDIEVRKNTEWGSLRYGEFIFAVNAYCAENRLISLAELKLQNKHLFDAIARRRVKNPKIFTKLKIISRQNASLLSDRKIVELSSTLMRRDDLGTPEEIRRTSLLLYSEVKRRGLFTLLGIPLSVLNRWERDASFKITTAESKVA